MATYKAPLRDMQFVMQDLLNYEKHYQSLPACDEVNQELIDAILGEASKFSEEIVAPLNAVGDEVGCRLHSVAPRSPRKTCSPRPESHRSAPG